MRWWSGLFTCAVLLGVVLIPWGATKVAWSQGAALPQDEGDNLVQWRCTFCHSMDAPSLPRLDRSGWTEIVDRMIRWGAPLPPEEREIVIRYLVRHFGALPRP